MSMGRSLFAVSVLIAGVLPFGVGGCTDAGDLIGVIGLVGAGLCETDARCNDGLFCNGEERCVDGLCKDGVAPCSKDACDEEANVCTEPCSDESCDDGVFCNGVETCSFPDGNPVGLCVPGAPPCTTDQICAEESGRCVECVTNVDCPGGLSCAGGDCIEAPIEPMTILVQLKNEDTDSTHLLTAAENFDPSNRLGPNVSRVFETSSVLAGDLFTFRAGRNGVVFAKVDCEFVPRPSVDAPMGVVTWTGSELTCSGDFTEAP